MSKKINKIVLAYSGGLDTSVILHWLKKTYEAEVIAYCADVGQEEELDGLEEKAINTGASKAFILDLKDELASDFIFPAIRGNAIYEMRYYLGTSLARPLIAQKQAEIALSEGADALSHGATGKGNDQVRFELAFMALAPNLEIISPWRIWDFQGREDLIKYAAEEKIPVTATPEKPYSIDRNLMHISYEGGILEDPWQEPKKDMFIWTKSLEDAQNEPEYIEVEFEQGNAVAVNGQKMKPSGIISTLNKIGGAHGIGRVDIVENRLVGIKSRGIYETPGGTILHIAHRDLESITLDKDLQHMKDSIVEKYASLIYNGRWFDNEREALQTMIDHTQKNVNGTVRLQLYKGNARVVGRKSPTTIYNPALASFDKAGGYNQADAEGFIRIYGLAMKSSYKKSQ